MKKYLFIVTMLVTFSGVNLFAQEKPDTSSHQEKESITQVKDSSMANESVKEAEPWNKVCPVMGNKITQKLVL